MAIPRATGMLRTQIRRPLVGAVSPLRSSIQQVRAQSGTPPDGDIGGPYGQEPPPKKPGGASDVFQRNWYVFLWGEKNHQTILRWRANLGGGGTV